MGRTILNTIRKPARTLYKTYYADISQFLSHITTTRADTPGKAWSIKEMNEALERIIRIFEQYFPHEQHFCLERERLAASRAAVATATLIARQQL